LGSKGGRDGGRIGYQVFERPGGKKDRRGSR
jgi:hypothetical protein